MENIYERYEKKYLIDKQTFALLYAELENYAVKDEYGLQTIKNLYFDTDNFDVIDNCVLKPEYKEKMRLRGYNKITLDTKVYLEVKKKYKKKSYKRRIVLSLEEAYKYINGEEVSIEKNNNFEEINRYLLRKNVSPKIYIQYDRVALKGKEDKSLRITFDTNIKYRFDNLCLEDEENLQTLLSDDYYVLEIKVSNNYPLWFVEMLNKYKMYPASYSKSGRIYQSVIQR